MSTDVEIDRALATVTATLNDHRVEQFDSGEVQRIVTASLGGEQSLTVDEGGGIHETNGTRIGVLRRTPSGEWIAERQNDTAEHADTAVPSPASDEQ
jgi:hypothetical protein